MTNEQPPESARPTHHFTAPRGWLNDPNGLVFHDGEYHLFYQHHPGADVWGPMCWGHAVSRDLVTWEHLPIALRPDDLGMIFSGSAVVDHDDTAGFGAGTMVAVFTHHRTGRQVQSLATSEDRGRSWTPYGGNPVLVHPDGNPHFRDPKVFWYSNDGGTGHWVMVLAVSEEIWIYRSDDLRSWTHTDCYSEFGHEPGGLETPDLFALPVDGRMEDTRWVLTFGVVSRNRSGTATRYVIGSFDGARFVPAPDQPPRWVDHGPDFYAAQSWNDHPTRQRIWIAWASNWAYANHTPTAGWRGSMTIPREVTLVTTSTGRVVLSQRPVAALTARRRPLLSLGHQRIVSSEHLPESAALPSGAFELDMMVDVDATHAERMLLRLVANGDDAAVLAYDVKTGRLTLDRVGAGPTVGAETFFSSSTVDVPTPDGVLDLRVLVDISTIEVFAAQGTVCLTAQIFPCGQDRGLVLTGEGGAVAVQWCALHSLDHEPAVTDPAVGYPKTGARQPERPEGSEEPSWAG